MDWKGGRRSDNIDDRRDSPLSAGAPAGAMLLMRFLPYLLGSRIGRIILLVGGLGYAGAYFLGIDPLKLLGGQAVAPRQEQQLSPQEQELTDFMSVILGSTEDVWRQQFQQAGSQYREPVLVLFRQRVNSACGITGSAVGPFYCPGDSKLYIDLSFFQEMKNRLGAQGDFAQAYVIAHEVGHHVQNLLGVSSKIQNAQRGKSQIEANQLSVKLELQADCLAGIWAHYAQNDKIKLEVGDLEEAINAAAAVGDDRLQEQASGAVRPERFTHGTSEQRMEWFKRGYASGTVNDCNTFK
jgi:uncharacterized protein